ncbi:methyltransferase domain-containing protein [Rhizobium rhizogenes]|jgi:SAM-dependent methyltransferase|uniref:class I SAM-dependent methyltransferase n=1 Tax=Rhizobium rhizogenes TaxID=359 RepID=UPI003ECFE87C
MTSISPNEWHVSDLDRFVAECDRLGGPEHPDTIRAMANFSLTFDTQVDKSLDPFSDEYFAQQMALYIEIASRSFEPTTGELTRIDPIKHSQGANPYLSNNTTVISSHVRTISTVMTVANLPPAARVLDLGCGWGLSSEIMAFCGATIDAVDINPPFVELVNLRAAPRNYDIRARHGEFDSLEADGFYDLILFYECLHHASKPWELIERVKSFLSPTGKIAFAGEPVNEIWWPNWGMRLDYLSVYCIRKFGWFESGWSEAFIQACFRRAGLDVVVYPQIGLRNGSIGYAMLPDIPIEAKPTPETAGVHVAAAAALPPIGQETIIHGLYQTLLGRNADPTGIASFGPIAVSGPDGIAEVIRHIVGSEEYASFQNRKIAV